MAEFHDVSAGIGVAALRRMERHGLTRKQPRQGGSIIFLVVIGAVVAGAGVAGLHYRNELWDDDGHPDHVATSQEATGVPVTLTNAEEVAKEQSALLAPALSLSTPMIIGEPDAPTLDAGKPPPPKPKPAAAPVWKPKPKADPKPETKETLPSESEIFSKPE